MSRCTKADNPDITGRGVLWSFYLQGLLMVTNGILDIEQRDIVPSTLTILVICVALLYEAINETSIYLSLILHLLLCFHMLASHAVIVWVALKNNGGRSANDWSNMYHILQLAGFVVLGASVYFGIVIKRCDLGVLGFVGTKGFPIEWFAPAVVLPYILSALVTLLLSEYLKASPPTQSPQNRRDTTSMIHAVLVTVWITSLIFVMVLLESTLQGNRNCIDTPPDASKILPLVLNIPPIWLFMKHGFTRFGNSNLSKITWSFLNTFNIFKRIIDPIDSEISDVVQSNRPSDNSVEDTDDPFDNNHPDQLVPPVNSGMFTGSRMVLITGGQFTYSPGAASRPARTHDQSSEVV